MSQIAGGWPELKALIFDVVTLEKTPAGQALLRNELCPVLGDEKSVKVSCETHLPPLGW